MCVRGWCGNRFVLMRSAVTSHADHYEIQEPTSYLMNQLGVLLLTKANYGEAEPLMRRHLHIFLKFTNSTGHIHPHLKAAFGNYTGLLEAMEICHEELGQRLQDLGRDAGFNEASYNRLHAELMQ